MVAAVAEKEEALVLTMLKKSDGTEVEPILDTMAGFFACELIHDELFLKRNALPEELVAYRKREAERERQAELKKEQQAAERAEKEKEITAQILATIQSHSDGMFRLFDPERSKTYAFETAGDAAEFASWNLERTYECATEPEPVPDPIEPPSLDEAPDEAALVEGEQPN